MSDADLRELARRWRETEDPADERRYLTARVRAGDLDAAALGLMTPIWEGRVPRERLELLAYAGHRLAVAIRGDEIIELATYLADQSGVDVVLGSEVDADDLEAWSLGLYHWGPDAVEEVLGLCFAPWLEELAGRPTPDPADYDAGGWQYYDADYDHERLQQVLGAVSHHVPRLRVLVPVLPATQAPNAHSHYGPWQDVVHTAENIAAARDAAGERRRERVHSFWIGLTGGPGPEELLSSVRARLQEGLQ